MSEMEHRARVVCRLRYKDYLHYQTKAWEHWGKEHWRAVDYYTEQARENRSRARDAAFIVAGEYGPHWTWKAAA